MSLPPLVIDERLEAASTLPAAWYTDPQALALERGGVFARTWQLGADLADLEAAGVRLPEFRCEAFGPFAFVTLDVGAPGLAEWLKEVVTRTATLPLAQMRRLVRREYEVDCNWKVYVDNYLEGYHLPIVHPACSASWTTRPTGWSPSATPRSSTRPSGAERAPSGAIATPRGRCRTLSTSGSFLT